MITRSFVSRLTHFAKNCQGQFALMAALLAPVLLGLTGGVVDLFVYQNQQTMMQNAADYAALAAAREAALKGWSEQSAREVANASIAGNVQGKAYSEATSFKADVSVDEPKKSVTVTLDMDQHSFFVLGYFHNHPQIRVRATARALGETSLCVIGLDKASGLTVKLSKYGKLTAADCAVQSNSAAVDGLASLEHAVLSAAAVCTSGGYAGALGNYARKPTADCPSVDDPLSGRAPPPVGACDHTDLVVKAAKVTLKPGTYCGGIKAKSQTEINFEPGIYVIKDGNFDADSSAVISGDGVSMYFTGKGSHFTFDNTTEVDFKAPKTGPMAGILFFEDPASSPGTVFEISSKRAMNLLGTIYLPKGTLRVDANNKIAESSAYTVIVANKVDIGKYSEVVINADYDATDVPLPVGLTGPQSVRLVD
jgi:Putative Flp pilus-assembly TadE/G-like